MRKMKPLKPIGGNYIPKVMASIAGETTGMFHGVVAHDDWCNPLSNKGECNCNPTVTTMTHEEFQKRYPNGQP